MVANLENAQANLAFGKLFIPSKSVKLFLAKPENSHRTLDDVLVSFFHINKPLAISTIDEGPLNVYVDSEEESDVVDLAVEILKKTRGGNITVFDKLNLSEKKSAEDEAEFHSRIWGEYSKTQMHFCYKVFIVSDAVVNSIINYSNGETAGDLMNWHSSVHFRRLATARKALERKKIIFLKDASLPQSQIQYSLEYYATFKHHLSQTLKIYELQRVEFEKLAGIKSGYLSTIFNGESVTLNTNALEKSISALYDLAQGQTPQEIRRGIDIAKRKYKLSDRELAGFLGKSKASVFNVLIGKSKMHYENQKKLSGLLTEYLGEIYHDDSLFSNLRADLDTPLLQFNRTHQNGKTGSNGSYPNGSSNKYNGNGYHKNGVKSSHKNGNVAV